MNTVPCTLREARGIATRAREQLTDAGAHPERASDILFVLVVFGALANIALDIFCLAERALK